MKYDYLCQCCGAPALAHLNPDDFSLDGVTCDECSKLSRRERWDKMSEFRETNERLMKERNEKFKLQREEKL